MPTTSVVALAMTKRKEFCEAWISEDRRTEELVLDCDVLLFVMREICDIEQFW